MTDTKPPPTKAEVARVVAVMFAAAMRRIADQDKAA